MKVKGPPSRGGRGGVRVQISWEQVHAVRRLCRENGGAWGNGSSMRWAESLHTAGESGLLTQVLNEVKSLPDVRDTRIIQLRTLISRGEYNVPSDEIADLFIRRALADELVG